MDGPLIPVIVVLCGVEGQSEVMTVDCHNVDINQGNVSQVNANFKHISYCGFKFDFCEPTNTLSSNDDLIL